MYTRLFFVFVVYFSIFSAEFCFTCFSDVDVKTLILLGEWSAIVVTRHALLKAKASDNLRVEFFYFHLSVVPCCSDCVHLDHHPLSILRQNFAAVWKGPPSSAGPVKKIFVGGLNPSGK